MLTSLDIPIGGRTSIESLKIMVLDFVVTAKT